MAKFRKVDPRIWNDRKFMALSDDAKLVFLHLLTHPELTMLGAVKGSSNSLADGLRWAPERFRERLGELFGERLLRGSEEDRILWLPNFLKYNPPENPNVAQAIRAAFDLLPECELLIEIDKEVRAILETRPASFLSAYNGIVNGLGNGSPNGLGNGMPNQKQKQKQKQEHKQEHKQKSIPAAPESENEGGLFRAEPETLPFDTDQFKAAWESWKSYKRERKEKLPASTVKAQLKKLEKMGHDDAIASIEQSIANNWRGLFPVQAGQSSFGATTDKRSQQRAASRGREYPVDTTPLPTIG